MSGVDYRSALLYGRISRRIRLSPEARKDLRRVGNNKAQAAVRRRRIAQGLRSDGRRRQRPWRERVKVLDAGFVENGGQVLRITAPRTALQIGATVLMIWRPK